MSQACSGCGQVFVPGTTECEYCGRALVPSGLASSAGDFGVRHVAWPSIGLLIASIIYMSGWLFEDTRYWLDERAILIWAGAVPFWLLLVALFWQPYWGGWLMGFAIGLPILLGHTGMMWVMDDFHFQDDHIGIAAMFAGAAFGGWMLGRLLHLIIQQARRRSLQYRQ
ncbi:MAG: hypothetical protein AAF512_13915 [Pseudomonadota bacterium]